MPEVLAFPPSPPMKSTPSPEAIGRLTQLMQLCTFHEVLRQAHRSVTGQIPLDVESIAAIEFTAGSVLEVVFVPSPEACLRPVRFRLETLVTMLSRPLLIRAFSLAFPQIQALILQQLHDA